MTLYFTETELKYVVQLKGESEYGLKCRDDAPKKIKDSVNRKLNAHKKWLKNEGRSD